MERTIYLYGELAKKFTSKITVKAENLYKAMSALRANFPGFEQFVVEYTPGFHVKIGEIYRSEATLAEPISANSDIHIIPAISGGSGKMGAALAIVIGVLMIWNPMGWAVLGGAAGGVFTIGGATGMMLGSFAMGLVFAGISALLFAPPKSQGPSEKPENTPNTYFNGAVNTIAQGHPVPIGYGELIVGSAVISAGLESVNI